ncbi:hypothetical protein GGF46_005123 [Coemansia sp. RSA 552]|nr:hypothetical protein GGF46_005123 [Coemansia sp. RSA 552]
MSSGNSQQTEAPSQPFSLFHIPATVLSTLHLSPRLNRLSRPQQQASARPAGQYSTPHVDSSSVEAVGQALASARVARAVCHTCGGMEFAGATEQRAHFKSLVHGENVGRKVAWRRENPDAEVGPSEYPWAPVAAAGSDDGELSDSERPQQPTAEEEDWATADTSPYLWFTQRSTGGEEEHSVATYGVNRRVLVPKGTHGVHVDAEQAEQELAQMQLAPAPVKTQEERRAEKKAAREAQRKQGSNPPLPAVDPQSSLWAFISSNGGFFAAAVFDNRTGTAIVHKAIQRYTTRRKQGGLQSRHDGAANSAGAQIRLYNERKLQEEIHDFVRRWAPLLERCTRVFVRVPRTSHRGFFAPEGSKCVLGWGDSRVRPVPVSVGRPTVTELQRVYRKITTVHLAHFDLAQPTPDVAPELASASAENSGTDSDHTLEPEPQPDLMEFLHSTAQRILNAGLSDEQIVAYLCDNLGTLLDAFSDPAMGLRYLWDVPGVQAQRTPTLLHLASLVGRKDLVGFLLDNGEDPTVTGGHDPIFAGPVAYEVAKDRDTRDAFRIYRFEHEGEADGIDWARARVPEPLSREQQQENQARAQEKKRREREKKRQRARQQKERKKEQQQPQPAEKDDEGELLDAALARRQQEESSLKHRVGDMSQSELRARMLSMAYTAWPATSDSPQEPPPRPVSPASQRAIDRELRFQAAERRRQAPIGNTGGCTHCGKSLHGIVPFEQFDWKCCSIDCLHSQQQLFGTNV